MGKGPRKNGRKQGQPAKSTPAPNDAKPADANPPAAAPDSSCVGDALKLAAAGKLTEYLPPEVYKDERKILLDLLKENTDQHDKAILQLTAGMLGLTMTF